MIRIDMLVDKAGNLTGARSEPARGTVVEVTLKATPIYAITRKLEALGYGDQNFQSFTPWGTPSLKGKVSAFAGISIHEEDRGGFRRRAYRPFSLGRVLTDGD